MIPLFRLLPLLLAPSLAFAQADRDALLTGVTEIAATGVPGGVCAFGPQAFAVIAGKEGKKALLPIVAAAHFEKGRIVALGHNGYLNAVSDPGTGALLTNAARWVAAGKKLGVVGNGGLATYLKNVGLDATPLDGKDWNTKLTGLGALCLDAHSIRDTDVEPLAKFIREGGGLLTAATGWGWLQGGKDRNLATNFAGNTLLARAGLVFTAGTPDRTTEKGYSAEGDLSLLGAATAIAAVTDHANGKTKLTPEQLAQISATLSDAMRSVPPKDTLFLPKLAALSALPGATDFPTPAKPLRADNAIGRLMFTRNLQALRDARPEQLRAHPAAEAFPGLVPKEAPRIAKRILAIDTKVPAWHSTGLYAAPGELIHIQLPPEAVDKGLSVRIGCHTDGLWHLDKWQRAPEISRRESLKLADTPAANSFGGLVYIDVPDNCPLGTINVVISGAVEAPRFILGQTTVEEWKTKIRNFPAPWAELETKKVILSVPSAKIRALDDPDALMAVWDQVLDAEADLATISHDRKRPERIVPDTQISAGYMHSGYPIMTFLDHSVEHSLSTAEMKAGSWGHFHELGHNHQQGDWTFDGTTEVTCNLFSLYVMETVCGKEPGRGHDAMEPAQVEKRLRKHLETHAVFERWKNDPFLALTMYHQLRVAFGWETYKKVFAEYRNLPKSERPRGDDAERDQWMVRFSRAAGKNLSPFFQAWGVPTSDSARASIADLPAWMPPDWPRL